MDWPAWIADSGWLLVERGVFVASFLFAALSLRSNTRERRLQNLLTFTDRHQKVLGGILAHPRILDPKGSAVSPTQQEIHAVNFLFLHLKSAFEAHRAGLYRLPENLDADIRLTLSYPLTREIWEKVKQSHSKQFVAFVERAREGDREPRGLWKRWGRR